MRSIALANQKGGVGKTTTAVHLAHGLALAGGRVVQLDLDPQGNATVATQGMAVESVLEGGVFDLLEPLRDDLWILPSPGATRNLSPTTVPDVGRLRELMKALAEDGFDWAIVDCPPRMDAWGLAGISICDQVLLPMQAEFFAMHGLTQMLATLDTCAEGGDLLGIVVTMFDPRAEVETEIIADLRAKLDAKVCTSIIYRDTAFVEAASHGVTLFDYNLASVGARSYGELVREIIDGRT